MQPIHENASVSTGLGHAVHLAQSHGAQNLEGRVNAHLMLSLNP